MVRPRKRKDDVIVVKKYANRRLYDTGRSSYVTLEDLAEMIREGQEFIVQDAKTGEDLTQSVLTQIIVEQESKGPNMLPVSFLKQIIQFYGDGMQAFLPTYLDQAMKNFVQSQDQLRENMQKSFGSIMPMNSMEPLEEINRKNIEIMAKTMQMFSPFSTMFEDSDNKMSETAKNQK